MLWVGTGEAPDGLDIRPLALDDESIWVSDSPEHLYAKASRDAEDLGNHHFCEIGEVLIS
jgi:hypothetical protein